jgi:tellurite resistance protein TehA-like permease
MVLGVSISNILSLQINLSLIIVVNSLAIFFFLISVLAHVPAIVGHYRMTFAMSWFSFIFPNTALVSATFNIGRAFSCKALEITGLVLTIAAVAMYLFVCFMMIRATTLRHLLW